MNSTPQTENKFSIRFVNAKSKERVLKLVGEMKECFKPVETHTELKACEIIDKLTETPELYLKHPSLDSVKSSDQGIPIVKASSAPLRPFLFPTYPSAISEDYMIQSTPKFAEERRNFMISSREEHQRLLFAFQDRLTRELTSGDEHYIPSPFQTAMANIASDQDIPSFAIDKQRKETIQTRFNALLRKSQKQTHTVLEFQKRCAKLIQDEEQFHILQDKKAGKPENEIKDPKPLSITFPFSFLSDG
ncbi:hypothetical protein TVAG_185260 [Trichomonas vaginalis G3]|uniref:Uncharacterized protein n=1 Tax=Trichomonas vaginalis (strain ATCC PRA-98 / G3) TaxID=412133 RepID=A2D8H1_TRIV3|nr:hypothetical protein TVAGG3_0393130 [Trichomonas vaginalis G3]EAY23220.1 hypothetical protein TVAG_185260 [Trichomonas vaginalis G3]KAI5534131.1 hypothetical protein TVAGG3_0393130 [Trichomonas vaginalis G3]|eukprot:XP_001584206.1 hypothetical protein [Trichomonas vaginalis G3]